jgi:Na+-driven multidrug efflux pump
MSKPSEDSVSSENIFRIADELVREVDRTKKIVICMIVAVVIAVPVSWHLAPFVKGAPFMAIGYVAVATAIIFLAVGIRQWLVLSRWTTKYKAYKEMQRNVDKQLDFEGEKS